MSNRFHSLASLLVHPKFQMKLFQRAVLSSQLQIFDSSKLFWAQNGSAMLLKRLLTQLGLSIWFLSLSSEKTLALLKSYFSTNFRRNCNGSKCFGEFAPQYFTIELNENFLVISPNFVGCCQKTAPLSCPKGKGITRNIVRWRCYRHKSHLPSRSNELWRTPSPSRSNSWWRDCWTKLSVHLVDAKLN